MTRSAPRAHRPVHRLSIGSLAVGAALLGACAGGTTTADAPGTSGTPTSGSTGAATCAWGVKASKEVQNIAYPDTSATYWVIPYALAPGERLVLDGTYPDARYFSFITYAATGGALGVLPDRDITPAPGSTSPFQGDGSAAPGGRYRVEVTAEPIAGGAADNQVSAVPDPADPPTPNTTAPGAPDTTVPAEMPVATARLGTGGDAGTRGSLIYRVYVPASDADPAGGPLPEVSVAAAGATTTAVPTCPTAGPSANGVQVVNTYGPNTDTPAPARPVFVRPGRNANNLFPNPDNVYVATIVEHVPGEVVVVRGMAPTFPDTRTGEPITGDEQLRFWSLCTNEYRKPYPVTDCARDDQVPLDDQGWFTFVVSTPEDRPSNATTDQGVAWLDRGATDVDSVLLFRHMLADESFVESATNLAPGDQATAKMGDYAPVGARCPKAAFEAGGAAACGLPAPS